MSICPITAQEFDSVDGRWVSVKGLIDLVQDGVAVFEALTEFQLPHNIVTSSMSGHLVPGSSPKVRPDERLFCSSEGADQLLREYGRIRGWLREAAYLPAVARVIFTTQSYRGINSPWTTIYLESLWKKFPSPGNLERKLWAVRRRAEAILAAYDGDFSVAWRDIARGLLVSASIGKAAVVAVAYSLVQHRRGGLGETRFRTYKSARDFLVKIRSAVYTEEMELGVVEDYHMYETPLRVTYNGEPAASSEDGVHVHDCCLHYAHGRVQPVWLVRYDDDRCSRIAYSGDGHLDPQAELEWEKIAVPSPSFVKDDSAPAPRRRASRPTKRRSGTSSDTVKVTPQPTPVSVSEIVDNFDDLADWERELLKEMYEG